MRLHSNIRLPVQCTLLFSSCLPGLSSLLDIPLILSQTVGVQEEMFSQDQRASTVGKALALNAADVSLIPGTLDGPLSSSKSNF